MKSQYIFKIFFLLCFFILLIAGVGLYFIFRDFSPRNYRADSSGYSTSELKKYISNESELLAVPGELIVKYDKDNINLKSSFVAPKLWLFMNRHDIVDIDADLDSNIQLLNVGDDLDKKIAELESDDNVEYVQPNYIYRPASINTNDPERDKLWGLHNTGQIIEDEPSVVDSDIDAPEAWVINEGTNSEIIVAVIDTGVAYNHPDLSENMWDGQNCRNENNQALGGCMHGYDYEDNDKIPLPTNSSHGTHIAGTIAALKNNNIGIIGVAPNAKIMALKSDLTSISNIKSINFAKHNGAKVINASFGGPSYDYATKEAIDSFPGLFIAAAGNATNDHTLSNTYPCDYDSENVICVAATNQKDEITDFSDFGVNHVDIAAPGQSIFSTVADTVVFEEGFDNVVAPEAPTNWVVGGSNPNWGTRFIDDDLANLLITESTAPPYSNNALNHITSPTISLQESGASVSFLAVCDTEYILEESWDRIELQVSADGNTFESIPFPRVKDLAFAWNEAVLDILVGDSSELGAGVYYFDSVTIPAKFITENMKIRFVWTTNATENAYVGCFIDLLTVVSFSDGSDNIYTVHKGTSMAAPHVSGLAGLILGYRPNLSMSQLKSLILENGDSLDSLEDVTVTGMRINAQKSMQAASQIPLNEATITPSPNVSPNLTPTFTIVPSDSITCGPADRDANGEFSIFDFSNFASKYKKNCNDSSEDYGLCGGVDANHNGKVSIEDFQSFAIRYSLTSCALT